MIKWFLSLFKRKTEVERMNEHANEYFSQPENQIRIGTMGEWCGMKHHKTNIGKCFCDACELEISLCSCDFPRGIVMLLDRPIQMMMTDKTTIIR